MNEDSKVKVLVYNANDITKNGKLKKKNNARDMTEEEFIKYIMENKFNLSKGYIDLVGYIGLSNGERFKCSYSGIVIGVSGIMNKIEQLNKQETQGVKNESN